MTGLPALRSLWFNLENVTAIAETAWWSVPHRPNWKVPSPPPPEITQQPLYLHLQRLCEWRQNWTAHLILKWDSFPAARTAQLDEGQRAATDNDESRRPGGGGGLAEAWTLTASGVRHNPAWVFCLDSEILGSSFPVLPHPCQTLRGPVKRSRANSPPFQDTTNPLSLLSCHEGEFDAFRSRNLLVDRDLCRGRPTTMEGVGLDPVGEIAEDQY